MRKLFYLTLVVLVSFGSAEVHAQMSDRAIRRNNKKMMTYRGRKEWFPKEKRYTMVGVTLNAMNYYGDLAPKPSPLSTDLSLTRPAVGLVLAHRFGPRYTLTASLSYGTLRGSDNASADKNDEDASFRYKRNLSFRNRISELAVVPSMDLWENQQTYLSRLKWTPYAFAGIAVFHHNPQAQAPAFGVDGVTPLDEAGQWVDLQKLGTEGQYAQLRESDVNYGNKPYKLFQISIPFGVGARFRLNQLMDFSVEFGFRYLFTDYIDDVSKNYVDLGVFGDNELAKAMSYRSNELPEFQNLLISIPSTVDGHNRSYNVINGYGHENEWSWRGDKDRDVYMVTTFKLTYIVGKTYNRAKFR